MISNKPLNKVKKEIIGYQENRDQCCHKTVFKMIKNKFIKTRNINSYKI